jgi:hypothetical protein
MAYGSRNERPMSNVPVFLPCPTPGQRVSADPGPDPMRSGYVPVPFSFTLGENRGEHIGKVNGDMEL